MREMKPYLNVLVASRLNVIVQPYDADAYNYPGSIACECQAMANEMGKPVVLLGKNGDRFEFLPREEES